MKTKYSVLVINVLVILVSVLVGCSGQRMIISSAVTTNNPGLSTATAIQTSTIPSPTTQAAPTTATPAAAINLNISAAASLTDAIKVINTLYRAAKPNVTITANFSSSGTLQTQIENGAPVDVFISAAATQMDNLAKKNLILTDTRKNLLNNRVVLIVPLDSTLGLTSFNDLASDKVKKLAIGDPKFVPAGTYAAQAFDLLGITAQITPKEILGSDVRQVLTYVESGNVDAGIVYSTDALISTKVKVVATAPADINAKIVYPVAVIKASANPNAAREYLSFLFGAEAKAEFEKYGFNPVGQ